VKHYTITNRAGLLFLGMLVLAVFLSHFVFTQYEQSFRKHHETLANQSVRTVASELSRLLAKSKRTTAVFVKHNSELIWRFSHDPDNEDYYGQISRLLREHFPEHYSFTITDTEGQLHIDDFGEKLGPLCLRNIQNSLSGDHHGSVMVHPGPDEYHFDIMVPWSYQGTRRGVFFISYRLDMVARLLEVGQAEQHNLILTRSDEPGLIEITAHGGRDIIQRTRPVHLSPAELERVVYSSPVKDTHWLLNDIYDENLMSDYQLRLWKPLIGAWVIVLLLTSLSLFFIRKSESALRKLNDSLEDEISERTVDLYATNQALEDEISRRDKAESRQRIFSRAASQSSEIVYITSINDLIEYVNPCFEKATGYTSKEVIGRPASLLHSGAMDKASYNDVMKAILNKRPFSGVFINRRKNGELIYMDQTITPLVNDEGDIEHYIITAKDLTEDKNNQERLKYISDHDLLTGLYNRTYLEDHINILLSSSMPQAHHFALLYLDIDRFGILCEGMGHQASDMLIKDLAIRLMMAVREHDLAARFSSDEFVVFIDAPVNIDEVLPQLEQILEIFHEPFQVKNEQLSISASIGIAMYPQDAATFDELVKCAFSALKRAKKSDSGPYEFYQSGMAEHAAERIRLEHELKEACNNGEITFHYQPKTRVSDGKLTGFESLARWTRKEDGQTVPPCDFIPVLEETGLIIDFGRRAITEACKTLSQHINTSCPQTRIAINLSSKQFFDHNLIQHIQESMKEYDLPANLLEFELTESLLIHNIEEVISTLGKLHDLGCHLSLDDFGTGYSSLQYLKSLPFDTIKIDRSFIRDIQTNEEDKTLTETIITMSHTLGKRVIAEGVENTEQLDLLRSMSCDEIQGYLISKPISINTLDDWISSYVDACA
jgi:diguanylate cyclase (GGDEF)-like protein/PAS domain S-box-containing protein